MHGLDSFAFLAVGAEVPAIRPQLKAAPRESGVWRGPAPLIRVRRKGQTNREAASVAGESLPQHGPNLSHSTVMASSIVSPSCG